MPRSILSALACCFVRCVARASPALQALDASLLRDLLEAYSDADDLRPAACSTPDAGTVAATTFSFNWTGTNAASQWRSDFVRFEEGLFQASMTHADAGNNSWTIRIGTGGNIYSHFAPDRYGETLPPQNYDGAPWVDEVQQCVATNGPLNRNESLPAYYVHQAGAYQRDAPRTDVPFFSPALAKHCEGNWCAFASWGTQAHVPTPFTSPIAYVDRYANCGGGVLEHTRLIHNFADPTQSISADVDQTYFNVGWGGVRSSSLPYALEPDPETGVLDYGADDGVNDVDFVHLCKWGGNNLHGEPDHDGEGSGPWRGMRADLKDLGGYTTFSDGRLLVNQTIDPILTWCRIESEDCYSNTAGCMVATCSDSQIQAGTHTRIQLKVRARASPNCAYHARDGAMIVLGCDMRDTGFGHTHPSLRLSATEPCSPWADVGFVNTKTHAVLPVPFVRHWSWSPRNRKVYFAVHKTDAQEAIDLVNNLFDNSESETELIIDVRPTTNDVHVPAGYDPSDFHAFTYVYGRGMEHEHGSLEGQSRRRLGSTSRGVGTRDYSVFTINWWAGARLQAGSTFRNRGFFLTGALGSVEATAGPLTDMTAANKVELESWSPRRVDAYQSGMYFAVVAATEAEGEETACGELVPVCEGLSTPGTGYVPFFHVTCGTSTYFGPDPYNFAPDFGADFPNHGHTLGDTARSYQCDGEDVAIRPRWKLMGFFDPTTCTSLETSLYDEDTFTCLPTPSLTPSPIPSPTPSPTTAAPTNAPTEAPTKTHSMSPSTAPTSSPTPAGPWDLDYADMRANFSNANTVTLDYIAGVGRDFRIDLYKKDCATPVNTTLYSTSNDTTPISGNATHHALTITHSFVMGALASSDIWNVTSSKLEVCQKLHLVYNDLDITEDVREIDVDFDLKVDFNTTVALKEGVTENATDEVDFKEEVTAYKCNRTTFERDGAALAPNQELAVCIVSEDGNVDVAQLTDMNIKQGDPSEGKKVDVVIANIIQVKAITSISVVSKGILVRTRVPINRFSFETGKNITISGKVNLAFAGTAGTRKLRALVGEDSEEAGYTVTVNLQSEGDAVGEGQAPIGASDGYAIMGKGLGGLGLVVLALMGLMM